ncbi:MAG: hypothetical protein Q4C00_01520 [Bacillota bacterium]|nr:hypothetical protein [Bacillota bacterium]
MKKLTIEFEQPQIEVNGIVFDLQKSDGDIFQKAMDIEKKYEDLNADNEEEVLAALREVTAYIDEMLGSGAMAKISGGKPIGMVKSIEVMSLIAQACYETYNEKIVEEYE